MPRFNFNHFAGPLHLQAALGKLGDAFLEEKYGFNAAVSSTEETIWTEGGAYSFPASDSIMTVSSSSTDDAAAGIGLQTLQIWGLDSNHDQVTETVTLNGQTAVNTTNSYLRINRVRGLTEGSNATANAGTVYVGTGTVTAGVPANIYATLSPNEGNTLQSIYTVPAGYTAYLLNVLVTSFGSTSVVVTWRLKARPDGGIFTTRDKGLVTRAGDAHPHIGGVSFAEKTDIIITGQSSGSDVDATGDFSLLLIPN